MSFTASPVPTSAVYWTALDTATPVTDAAVHRLITALSDIHGALRAVTRPGDDGSGPYTDIPDEPAVAPEEVLADRRTGPGDLASSLDPARGLVWRVSVLSDSRLLMAVHRGVVDADSWPVLVADARALLAGDPVSTGGQWEPAAVTDPPASFDGGGPATYKTFDVSDPEALLGLLPDQTGVSHGEILITAVALGRATAGMPAAPVALRARGRTPDAGGDRTVGRLDRQYTVPAPGLPAETSPDELLTGGPAVLGVLAGVRDSLRYAAPASPDDSDVSDVSDVSATVEVSAAKVSVSGPVRPVDGVCHVMMGTQHPARVTVVDERGGAGSVLLWPHLEQALISLSALARLIEAGLTGPAVPAVPAGPAVPAVSRNLFGDPAATPDRTVNLTELPEVDGFRVARRLHQAHPGGMTLVRMPGVTDPKATGGRSGRVGSGVTGRLITG